MARKPVTLPDIPATPDTPFRPGVWIELPNPRDLTETQRTQVIEMANRMLDRLAKTGDPHGVFGWDSRAALYDYGGPCIGAEVLADHGKWFALPYFGREGA